MEKKKFLVYISAFTFSILLFLFMAFLSYSNTSQRIELKLDSHYSSISNLNQMESLFYSQNILVAQQFSGMDPISLPTFQSYATSFLKLYQVEYEKTTTAEEINYIYQINSQYSSYVDMFTRLQNFDFSTPKGQQDAYYYYKLTISPQVTSIFSSLNTYREYMEQKLVEEQDSFIHTTRFDISILFLLFLVLSILMFVVSNVTINKHIVPMENLLRDQQKFEKMKSDFISTVSHEFKTPLTSIIMGTDLLQNNALGKLNDDQLELVCTIKEDSVSLTNLVNNLLQLSKFDSSEVSYSFNKENIVELIKLSASQFSHMPSKAGIIVKYDIADNLPSVNADKEKIIWVMNNILSNAFKYSDNGDTITISASQDIDDYIIVQVADQGPGIPPEYHEKIFERYFQVNDSDIELGGTGMGLAISKEIISAHGGKIWCASNHPRGSVFSFTIPVLNIISLDIKR